MTAITVEEFAADVYKYIEMAKIGELLINCNNGDRLFLHNEPEEKLPGVDYSIISPEDLEDHKRAMKSMAEGRYYSMFPEETAEEFFNRIDSDPEKWLECNLRKERYS